jgi:uncharacterized membrane protein YtjA (UPF0391 family)
LGLAILKGDRMFLYAAIIFGILAFIAGIFGFTNVATGSAEIAKILFAIFFIGLIVFFVLGFLFV